MPSSAKNRLNTAWNTIRFITKLAAGDQRRHLFEWVRSLNVVTPFYLTEKPSPWLTFDAIEVLRQQHMTDWRVFEYGSGGSTLFWLKLGATCVSIEHDPNWFEVISRRTSGQSALDYRLVLPSRHNRRCSEPIDVADPNCYASDDLAFADYDFYDYVTQIDTFPDGYFDLIVVDGRARPSCIAHSVAKLKRGGFLVLDNADRKYYTERTAPLLRGMKHSVFIGATPVYSHFSRTDIYQNV